MMSTAWNTSSRLSFSQVKFYLYDTILQQKPLNNSSISLVSDFFFFFESTLPNALESLNKVNVNSLVPLL